MDNSKKAFPIGVMFASGLILCSCWMFWTLPNFVFPPGTGGVVMLAPDEGWHGSMDLMGFTIPHWPIGCCAGVIALLSLFGFMGIVRAPVLIPLLLSLYGLLHSGAIIVFGTDKFTGTGLMLAFVCFLSLSILSLRPLLVKYSPINNVFRNSLIGSRCHAIYILVTGIFPKKEHAFRMIVIASIAFICCFSLFFYDLRLVILPGIIAKVIPALCVLAVAFGIKFSIYDRKISTAFLGILVLSIMLEAMSIRIWYGHHYNQGEMYWHTWFEFDPLH